VGRLERERTGFINPVWRKGVTQSHQGGVAVAERVELLKQLDAIVTTIAESEDPVTWSCWLGYILEAMEDEANEEKYTDFLRRLRSAITARLDTGRW
jgi:hypothetical protein